MTIPPATGVRTSPEVERPYQRLAGDTRYGHYARIPERVCRCLEHFGVTFDRAAVAERLRAYYVFVGVADDAIDAGSVQAGARILEQLIADAPSFEDGAQLSAARLATEALRRHLRTDPHPALRNTLAELYRAVVREREALTMRAYVAERKAVGHLTADASYLLIRPLLSGGAREESLRRFFRHVGEVGCLLDSVIDLGADERLGLLNFKPTVTDRLHLAARTIIEGAKVLLRHPRLLDLFFEAAHDDLLDRLSARAAPPSPDSTDTVPAARVCERAA